MRFVVFAVLLVICFGIGAHAAFNRLKWWAVPAIAALPLAIAAAVAIGERSYRSDETFIEVAVIGLIMAFGSLIVGVTVGRKLTKLPVDN